MEPSTIKRCLLYARVSTDKQTVDNQLPALRTYAHMQGWKVVGEIEDEGYTGRNQNRPGFKRMWDMAKAKSFDVLLVFYLDRLGRSTLEVLRTAQELKDLGIDIVMTRLNVDTTTAVGKMQFQMMSALAEFESAIKGERIKAWAQKRKEMGLSLGRKKSIQITVEQVRSIRAHMSVRDAARQLGISPTSVVRLSGS